MLGKALICALVLAAVFIHAEDSQADVLTASFYDPALSGAVTASGDVYDHSELTAASPHLPFGTVLYVEHAGAGVEVEVTDRGPHAGDRSLDLSGAAAERIGLVEQGVADVYVEILYLP